MRWLLFRILPLIAILVFAQVVARTMGGTIPVQARAILRPELCPQPCWFEIRPATTTLEQAEEILRMHKAFIPNTSRVVASTSASATRELCWSIQGSRLWTGCASRAGSAGLGGPIVLLEFSPPWGSLSLGEAIQVLGTPRVGMLCRRAAGGLNYYYLAVVHFPGNIEVSGYNALSPRAQRFDPHMQITSIRYNSPSAEPPYRFDAPAWRGFAALSEDQLGC